MNEVYCSGCGKLHIEGEGFYKNDKDGTIFCEACFQKHIKKGKIE